MSQISPLLHRLIGTAIAGVLAANGVALVVGVGQASTASPPAPVVVGGAAGVAADTVAATITDASGMQVTVDPSTPEGQQAIAEARARGDEVVLASAPGAKPSSLGGPPATASDGTPIPVPGARPVVAGGSVPGTSLIDAIVGAVANQTDGHTGTTSDGSSSSTTIPTTGTTLLPDTTIPQTTLPTLPPVTIPPTTLPSVTIPPTTLPSVTIPPTTLPSVTTTTVPPVTTTVLAPVTIPPTTLPPVTIPPTTIPHL